MSLKRSSSAEFQLKPKHCTHGYTHKSEMIKVNVSCDLRFGTAGKFASAALDLLTLDSVVPSCSAKTDKSGSLCSEYSSKMKQTADELTIKNVFTPFPLSKFTKQL